MSPVLDCDRANVLKRADFVTAAFGYPYFSFLFFDACLSQAAILAYKS